jgi:RNA polymerase sigma factor (sigma-70 family)
VSAGHKRIPLQAARAGQELGTFEALRPELLGLASVLLRMSRVRCSPEDLVQSALLRIYTGLLEGRLDVTALVSPRQFAYVVLKNLFRDELRAARTRLEDLLDAEQERRFEETAASSDDGVELGDLLSRFSPCERCFLYCVFVESRPVVEAAALCGWPDASPYYHLRQLLARIRVMTR